MQLVFGLIMGNVKGFGWILRKPLFLAAACACLRGFCASRPLDRMPRGLHNVPWLFEIGLSGTTNCHLYHYAGNNPVRYILTWTGYKQKLVLILRIFKNSYN
ncbi:MAG: hypothetical protein IJU95_06000 [Treponema sp.]|nr:hypothetical protein [Treponema sp.]